MSTAMKSCNRCGGAILTGVTGWGGAICTCRVSDTSSHWGIEVVDKTGEIQTLRKQVAELKQERNDLNYLAMERLHEIEALSLQNQVLRDALDKCVEALSELIINTQTEYEQQAKNYEGYPNLYYKYGYLKDDYTRGENAYTNAKEALSTTPNQDDWIRKSDLERVAIVPDHVGGFDQLFKIRGE